VADIDALLYLPDRYIACMRKALDIPALSPGWQGSFRELVNAAETPAPAWPGFQPLKVVGVARDQATNDASFRSMVVEATGAMHAALTAAVRWEVIGEPYAVDVERQKLGEVTLSIRWGSDGHGVRSRFTVRALKPADAPFISQDD
jgi:hypothetical protein